MTVLAILGWLVLCAAAFIAMLETVQLFYLCVGFTGRLPWQWWLYALGAVGLVTLSVYTFPFKVEVKAEGDSGQR